MTKPFRYVPILKGKEGEFAALEALTVEVQSALAPLIEVPNIPYDYAQERNAKTLDDHVSGIADRLKRCWKSDGVVYLDFPWFDAAELLESGNAALALVLGACKQLPFPVIPVVSRSSSVSYLSIVESHNADCGTGICLRLRIDDFGEDIDPTAEIDRMRQSIGNIGFDKIDLLLDLGDLGPDSNRATLVARSIFSMVPLHSWRRAIIAGASFPEDLSNVDAATEARLPRIEWEMWLNLMRRPNLLPFKNLIFGDYAISHPTPRELDPRTMRMSASIRYTTPTCWLVVKGRNVRQFGFEQYFALAQALVAMPEYSGADYSWGDEFISRCAVGENGPGNATTWRKVGTNHHLTMVIRQLA